MQNNDSLMFNFGDSQLTQRKDDYNKEPKPKTKLIAGYVDPEWTKIIQERNEKTFIKRNLNKDQKLLAQDKAIKAMAKEGK